MKAKVVFLVLLMLGFVLTGCNGTNIRVRDFVDHYNVNMSSENFTRMYQNGSTMIRSTTAEVVPAEIAGGTLGIKLTFVSIFTAKSPSAQIYKKFIPIAFTSLITNNKEAKKLLEKGVKFYICFNSRNNHLIKEVIIDQKNMSNFIYASSSYTYLYNGSLVYWVIV
jgi:hypothetical protein